MGGMSAIASDLTTPVLLLAMPQVLDPFFHKSVVLLLHHEDEGSFGFIVNRPTGIKLQEILEGMEVSWRGDEADVAHFGGPVQPQLGTVLFSPGPVETEAATEVLPGISITQHIGDLARLLRLAIEPAGKILGRDDDGHAVVNVAEVRGGVSGQDRAGIDL